MAQAVYARVSIKEVEMPKVVFTKETWPRSLEEFRKALKEAWEEANPVDDFVEVVRELTLLEQKYGMNSAEFYERFQRGGLGDEEDFMKWATYFEMYEEMRETFEDLVSLFEAYPLPLPVSYDSQVKPVSG